MKHIMVNDEGRVESPGARPEDSAKGVSKTLQALFLGELADLYSAEKQTAKVLPKMAELAESDELRESVESHLRETENHMNRLERVAQSMGHVLKPQKCKGMEGILADGEDMIKEQKGKPTLDATLIAALQKVEHYEIASYGTVCAWAKQMEHDEAVSLLLETLSEEKSADDELTQLAELLANAKA